MRYTPGRKYTTHPRSPHTFNEYLKYISRRKVLSGKIARADTLDRHHHHSKHSGVGQLVVKVQRYLAHQKTPTPLGTP